MSPHLNENEEMRKIRGFENYGITSQGRVWSYISNIWLKPTINKKGNHRRLYVSLGRGNKRYIHRLVAEAFLPNPDNLPEVDHIDSNGMNNNVENLRWVTHEANMKNIITQDKIKSNTGYYVEIKELKTGKLYSGYQEVAEKCGVSKATVWKHLAKKVKNPKWEFTGNRIRPN